MGRIKEWRVIVNMLPAGAAAKQFSVITDDRGLAGRVRERGAFFRMVWWSIVDSAVYVCVRKFRKTVSVFVVVSVTVCSETF